MQREVFKIMSYFYLLWPTNGTDYYLSYWNSHLKTSLARNKQWLRVNDHFLTPRAHSAPRYKDIIYLSHNLHQFIMYLTLHLVYVWPEDSPLFITYLMGSYNPLWMLATPSTSNSNSVCSPTGAHLSDPLSSCKLASIAPVHRWCSQLSVYWQFAI